MQAFTVDSCIMRVVCVAELDLGTFAAIQQHVVVDGLPTSNRPRLGPSWLLNQLALLHMSQHVSCTSGCDVKIRFEQVRHLFS
jgi:hypothetical protein